MNLTKQQVLNLRRLLVVGETVLARRSMDLGFGLWDCGTYACLLGHYGRAIDQHMGTYTDQRFMLEHFGFNWEVHGDVAETLFGKGFCDAIFNKTASLPGDGAYIELEKRLAYLRDLIASHEPKTKHVGIPDSVRAIFDSAAEERGGVFADYDYCESKAPLSEGVSGK